MEIQSCRYLVALVISLFILGCGGNPCSTANITNFSIFSGPMFDDSMGESPPYRGSSRSAVFFIKANGVQTPPVASLFRNPITFSPFPLAQANQPCDFRFLESITAIDVRSSQDIDSDHPAGSLLNDLMKVEQFENYLKPLRNLSEFFPINQPDFHFALIFYFAKPPIAGGLHRFTLDIHLDNGVIHTVETEVIDLSKFRELIEPSIL